MFGPTMRVVWHHDMIFVDVLHTGGIVNYTAALITPATRVLEWFDGVDEDRKIQVRAFLVNIGLLFTE
jgi:hypothetical protein